MSSLHKQKEDELILIVNLFKDGAKNEAQLQMQRFLARDAIEYANNISRICNAYDNRIQALEQTINNSKDINSSRDKQEKESFNKFSMLRNQHADERRDLTNTIVELQADNAKLREELKRPSGALPKKLLGITPKKTKVAGEEKRKPGRPQKKVKVFSSNISSTVANAAKELQNV